MFEPGDKLTYTSNIKDKFLARSWPVFFIGMWVSSEGQVSKNKAVIREANMTGLLKVIDLTELTKG